MLKNRRGLLSRINTGILPGMLLLSIVCFVFFIHATTPEDPKQAVGYTGRSEKDAAIWQSGLRNKLFHLLKMEDLLATRDSIALDAKEILSEDKGTYIQKEIEFNSTKTRRIRVVFTVPSKKDGKWPAVVSLHGHGGKSHSVYDKSTVYKGFATELAGRNYVTISPMVSQHVVYEEGRTLMGERLWDVMRCIDYLESLASVDKNRIGAAGLSLGGEMTMWIGAMDERIRAAMSSGFLTKMDQMEQNHCMCWKFPGLRELVNDYSDIYSLTAPRALLCQNGLKEPANDFTVALAKDALKEIEVIYKDFKAPEKVSLVPHKGAHEIDMPSLLAFFDKELGASNMRKMQYTSRSPKEAEKWQGEVRRKLFTLLRLDDLLSYQKSIVLNPKEIRSENKDGYVLKEIEFNSTPDRRIRVLFTIPAKTKGPWPAVVTIHGHGGTPGIVYDKTTEYKGFATELAERNYITISPIVSQHMVYESGRTMMGERLWDAIRCVDYLESLDEVNKNEIGCAGLSLGGEMTMWLGAMDTRVKSVISSGFLTTMDQIETHICSSYMYFQGFPDIWKHDRCWKFNGLRELVDFADIYSLIAPRSLQCQNGLKEGPRSFYVPIAQVALKDIQTIYNDFKRPQNVELLVHEGAHEVHIPSLLTFFDKEFESRRNTKQ